jgi:hypothetical protein
LDGYFSLKWITIVKRTTTASALEVVKTPTVPLERRRLGEFLVAPHHDLHYNSPWFKPKSKTEEKTAVK